MACGSWLSSLTLNTGPSSPSPPLMERRTFSIDIYPRSFLPPPLLLSPYTSRSPSASVSHLTVNDSLSAFIASFFPLHGPLSSFVSHFLTASLSLCTVYHTCICIVRLCIYNYLICVYLSTYWSDKVNAMDRIRTLIVDLDQNSPSELLVFSPN